MPKRLFYIVGVLLGFFIGFLFGEVLRRKRMERLAILEEQKAARHARHVAFEKRWQERMSTFTPEEKIDWAMFEAEMEADNWEGSWVEDETEE